MSQGLTVDKEAKTAAPTKRQYIFSRESVGAVSKLLLMPFSLKLVAYRLFSQPIQRVNQHHLDVPWLDKVGMGRCSFRLFFMYSSEFILPSGPTR